MKKVRKHPKDMTSDEAISHIFHPKVLKHIKDHIANIEKEKEKKQSKKD